MPRSRRARHRCGQPLPRCPGGPSAGVVVEQLAADERPRVVLAQVEVAQLRQVVAEGLVDLLAHAGDRRPHPLEPGGGLLGQVRQALGAEDEERGEGQDDDLAPADRVEHRAPLLRGRRRDRSQRRRARGQAASSVASTPRRAPAAHDLDGHRLAGLVRVDRDRRAPPSCATGSPSTAMTTSCSRMPGGRRGAARLDVEHQCAVAGAVGDRAGVDPERGVHRRRRWR